MPKSIIRKLLDENTIEDLKQKHAEDLAETNENHARKVEELQTVIDQCREDIDVLKEEADEQSDTLMPLESPSKSLKFVKNNALIDIHSSFVHDMPTTTRLNSRHRIDFMFASEGISQWVVEAGYRALHEGLSSDHIMLWVDLDLARFFNGKSGIKATPQSREYSFDNKFIRDQVIDELIKLNKIHRIEERIHSLDRRFQIHGSSLSLVSEYNKLDRAIIRNIKAAVKQVIKRKQFGYHRSTELIKAGRSISYWKAALTSKRNYLPPTEHMDKLRQEAFIDHAPFDDLLEHEIQIQLQRAHQQLKTCQINASELRIKWLESVARYKAGIEGDEEARKNLAPGPGFFPAW